MYKLLLTFAVACVLFSCSKNNSPGPQTQTVGAAGMMPLAVGNQWTYKKSFYDSASGVVDSTGSDAWNIIQQTTVNDTTYFQFVQSAKLETWASFIINRDSNTVVKIDSASYYDFFKRVGSNTPAFSWADTVTSRCKGTNTLYGFAADSTVDGYAGCLKNTVTVADCTGQPFELWVYYFAPGTGFVRIEHYLIKNDNVTWYLDFVEDLQSFLKG